MNFPSWVFRECHKHAFGFVHPSTGRHMFCTDVNWKARSFDWKEPQ